MKRTVLGLVALLSGLVSCAGFEPVSRSDLVDRTHLGRSRIVLADSTVYRLSDTWVMDGMVVGQRGSHLVEIPVDSVLQAERVGFQPEGPVIAVMAHVTAFMVFSRMSHHGKIFSPSKGRP